jgi:hypothetical protein
MHPILALRGKKFSVIVLDQEQKFGPSVQLLDVSH